MQFPKPCWNSYILALCEVPAEKNQLDCQLEVILNFKTTAGVIGFPILS